MARTKGAQDIKGWREHGLLRDLALAEETPEELAEKYGIELQSIYAFRHRNKHRIAVTLAEWSDQFSDLWSVKKHARVADLQYLADQIQARMDELIEDAERATETLRSVDPTAGPVRVPLRDWRGLTRDKAKLLDQIMTEMGQNPQQIAALAEDYNFKRQVLDLTPFKALRTYPIDVRLDELVNRLVADNGFLVGVESRLQWLIGEIVAAHDPSYVNDAGADLELARRSRFGRPVDRRLEAIRDQLVGLGFVGRVVGQLRPRIESHWTGDWPDPAPVSFERLSDTDHQRYVEIRDHLVADDGFRDLVGEQLERDYVEVLQARPDWRDPAPVEEPEPEPVQAIEPAPAPAVEPAPVIAEGLPPVPSPEQPENHLTTDQVRCYFSLSKSYGLGHI